MTIKKHRSLLLAEAVCGMLVILIGDGENLGECELVVSSAVIGAQPGLQIVDALGGHVAWIFSRHKTPGIHVILGDRQRRGYDLDRVPLPNNDSEEYDFAEDEATHAAQCIFDFFKQTSNNQVL